MTVKNNEGATDTVVIDNVGMLYSKGQYPGGTIGASTGVVKLYDSMDSDRPIAQVKAQQPNNSYKQRSVGIAKFENLNLKAEGGRLFYEILDESGADILHSARYSVEYAPESGEVITEPTAELKGSVRGYQGRSRYGILNLSGLPEGAEVRVYESADADHPIRFSVPAKEDGKVSIDGIPLKKEGAGEVYYEVFVSGRPNSDRFSVAYDSAMAVKADLSGLNELIEKCSRYTAEDCTSATFPAFEEALNEAKAVKDGVDTKTAEEARAKLSEAFANLRGRANTQRLGELVKLYEDAHPELEYTGTSYGRFKAELDKCKAMIKADDSSAFEVEQARIKLEESVRGLVKDNGATVTGVTVDPSTVTLDRGVSQKFTAAVTGTGDPTQAVTWTVSGNQSSKTSIKADGTLKISTEETATTLTVTATSKLDETQSASATVTVTEKVVAPSITVTVTPGELKVTADAGQKGQFTAIVKGAESNDVVWTISGNTDENTLIGNGQLFLGKDETATEMTVTATSVENPDCVGTAKVIVVRTDKTLLQKTYEYAQSLSTEGSVDSAVKVFEAAKQHAADVLADGLADEATVDQAWKDLIYAIHGLGVMQGNKENLDKLIAMAEEMVASKDKYVEKNWQTLLDALDAAKATTDNGDALQEDVDAAADALLEAIMMQRFKANKENLGGLIDKANGLDLNKYTDESVQFFLAVLKEANGVMANDDLSEDDQAIVDGAEAKLAAAIEGLTLKDGGSENVPGGSTGNDSGNDGDNTGSPDTGDYSPLLGVALALAAIGAGTLVLRRRSYNK